MSGGLVPPIVGQDGPTLEQLLSRNLKSWKPFSNDADFKEALNDWLEHVTTQLAGGSGDAAQLRATVLYITTTLGYLSSYGHKLVYQYHKDVTRAMRKDPPLYNPLSNGPTYFPAFMMHLHSASTSSATRSRGSQSSSSRSDRKQTAASRGTQANKRTQSASSASRADEPCDRHENGDHTNGECRLQQNKRRAAGKPSAAAASNN